MKAPRPSDTPLRPPSDPSPAPEPIPTTEQTYYYDPFDGYLHSPTSFAIHNIKPETEDEARKILLDTFRRANSLALVASQYRQEDHPVKDVAGHCQVNLGSPKTSSTGIIFWPSMTL